METALLIQTTDTDESNPMQLCTCCAKLWVSKNGSPLCLTCLSVNWIDDSAPQFEGEDL